MNKLSLSVTKKIAPYSFLMVDDNIVKPKYKRGVGTAEIETEKSEVTLSYCFFSRFDNKLWWLFEMLYYLLSVFGLFDVRFRKHEYINNCKITIKLNADTKAKVHLPHPRSGGPVLKVDTTAETVVESNTYEIDKTATKKKKGLFIAKIIVTIAIVATLAFILI